MSGYLYKSVLLCDQSDEKIEAIRAQFVHSLGLDEQAYKAVVADYSHLINTNSFFEEKKRVTLVCALPMNVSCIKDFDDLLL